jgi:hypothetical protein
MRSGPLLKGPPILLQLQHGIKFSAVIVVGHDWQNTNCTFLVAIPQYINNTIQVLEDP